jgi:MazG family protein
VSSVACNGYKPAPAPNLKLVDRLDHMRQESVDALRELNEVVERLRAPGGCPWDREQTHRTLRPYLLEETYEVLDAIDNRGAATLREELGDLLLQVLMHCAIAQEEEGGFDIGQVADVTKAKMINRHPHVFGDVVVDGAADVVVNWEKLKSAEKQDRLSVLDGVPHALPALAYAQGVQKRPARVGFDETPTVQAALGRVHEALQQVEEMVSSSTVTSVQGEDWALSERDVTGSQDAEDAVGDLLFAVVALSRHLRVIPEEALRRRTTTFADRFRALEAQARQEAVDLHDLDVAEWRTRWKNAATLSNSR